MNDRVFEEMKRSVGFCDADARTLAGLADRVAPVLHEVVALFYAKLVKSPETRAVFAGGEAQVQRLRWALLSWLHDLFSGVYDARYFQRRWEIGRMHVRISLPHQYVFTSMSMVRQALTERIARMRVREGARAVSALNKLLDLELAIMSEAYRETYAERIREIERSHYQQRLSESEHMAAIGGLAASLAHEIKNPLAGISGAIQVLGADLPPGHPHKDVIAEALRQIDRLDATVRDLLIYARPRPPARAPNDLGYMLERAVLLFREEPAFRNVEVVFAGMDGESVVAVDEAQFHQVITNLMLNAAHACDHAGRIECRLSRHDSSVRIEVRDNGHGMTPEVLARACEPFFTTKVRGSGLGLSICKRIIEDHGGVMAVHSAPGEGTQVVIDIPK